MVQDPVLHHYHSDVEPYRGVVGTYLPGAYKSCWTLAGTVMEQG